MPPTSNNVLAATTSMIVPSSAYIDRLQSLVPSAEAQRQAGYIREQLTDQQLLGKKRCLRCGARPFHKVGKPKPRSNDRKPLEAAPSSQKRSSINNTSESTKGSSILTTEKPNQLRCKFHPGEVVGKTWTCCRKHVSEAPCGGADDHVLRHDPGDRALKKRWQFYETPVQTRPDHRLAVSIDCEMGSASDGESELIRLTVVDYFSGQTLIDTLVYPSISMLHFNTRWSGVTRGQMERARKQRQCLFGTATARTAIFKYVGRGTLVVGHGLQNDLLCLRWLHDRIVDSYLIESGIRKEAQMRAEEERKTTGLETASAFLEVGQAKNKTSGGGRHPNGMSLKSLALKKLGLSIQEGKGHDSLEDAVAARDLVHSYVVGLSGPSAS